MPAAWHWHTDLIINASGMDLCQWHADEQATSAALYVDNTYCTALHYQDNIHNRESEEDFFMKISAWSS